MTALAVDLKGDIVGGVALDLCTREVSTRRDKFCAEYLWWVRAQQLNRGRRGHYLPMVPALRW